MTNHYLPNNIHLYEITIHYHTNHHYRTHSKHAFLAQIESDQRNDNQDFWSTYFIAPLDTTDNRFVIDNKTPDDKIFHYSITNNENDTSQDGDIEIKTNTRKIVKTDENNNNYPVTIIITTDNEEKILEKK